jgi:hypothetical protein
MKNIEKIELLEQYIDQDIRDVFMNDRHRENIEENLVEAKIMKREPEILLNCLEVIEDILTRNFYEEEVLLFTVGSLYYAIYRSQNKVPEENYLEEKFPKLFEMTQRRVPFKARECIIEDIQSTKVYPLFDDYVKSLENKYKDDTDLLLDIMACLYASISGDEEEDRNTNYLFLTYLKLYNQMVKDTPNKRLYLFQFPKMFNYVRSKAVLALKTDLTKELDNAEDIHEFKTAAVEELLTLVADEISYNSEENKFFSLSEPYIKWTQKKGYNVDYVNKMNKIISKYKALLQEETEIDKVIDEIGEIKV